jgi:hypothetical protein
MSTLSHSRSNFSLVLPCLEDDDPVAVISERRPLHAATSSFNFERRPTLCCSHLRLLYTSLSPAAAAFPSLSICCCCPEGRRPSSRKSEGITIDAFSFLELRIPACAWRPLCRSRGKVCMGQGRRGKRGIWCVHVQRASRRVPALQVGQVGQGVVGEFPLAPHPSG